MNVFDKAVEVVNPERALKRFDARIRLKTLKEIKDTGYSNSGASKKKNYGKGWSADSKSPQEDIDKNLPTLRVRSRDLMMSAPLATSAVRTMRTNVVGSGLIPKPKIDSDFLKLTDEEAEYWQKNTEKEFKIWAESKLSDVRKLNNFYENQQLIMLSQLVNGDACCIFLFEETNKKIMPYGIRLNIIESDRVCNPESNGSHVNLQCKNPDNGNRIYSGVEIDEKGAVVAYHICNTYPSSNLNLKKEWTRVEAFGKETGLENVLMIFDSERAEQYRGVPLLAPVIECLKQITRYTEAELMAAVVGSFFTAFIKTTERSSGDDLFTGVTDEEESVAERSNEYEMGPGTINLLEPGEEVEFGDPKYPGDNFDVFILTLSKYIGAALEIPVEILTKSFNASYSASRAALLEAWKTFRMRRKWLVDDFCQPVYERWLMEAVAIGRIKAPGFFYDPAIRKAWCGCQWNGPAPGMVDPLKEVEASEKKIALGISTREKEAAELNGTDFKENIRQIEKEMREIDKIIGGNDNNG